MLHFCLALLLISGNLECAFDQWESVCDECVEGKEARTEVLPFLGCSLFVPCIQHYDAIAGIFSQLVLVVWG